MGLIRSNLGAAFRETRDPRVAPLHPARSMVRGDAGGLPASSGKAASRLAALRQAVEKIERGGHDTAAATLPLGVAEIDRFLPGGGLASGALHEVAAAQHGAKPAAFGFVMALAALAQGARRGPTVLVLSRRACKDFGSPYGHGLQRLGLDPARLIIVETRGDKDALWAIEETVKSKAALAMVVALLGSDRDLSRHLTESRRMSLAAAATGTPLVLVSSPAGTQASAAVTRWRISAAAAAERRLGSDTTQPFARSRWSVALERCRNGCTGQWLIEWDHVAHRFHLAQGLADHAPLTGRGEERRRVVRQLAG
jgi:protein ImuA